MNDMNYTKITRVEANALAAWSLPVFRFDPDGTCHEMPGAPAGAILPLQQPVIPGRCKKGGWYGVPDDFIMVHLEFQDRSNPYVMRKHPVNIMAKLRKWRWQGRIKVQKNRQDGHGILYLYVMNQDRKEALNCP